MAFLGLRTVIYRVPDLGAATTWYTAVLGYAPYFDEPFYVGFEVAGYELGLQPIEDQQVTPSQTVQVYWGVTDVAGMYERMIALGATPHESPTEVGGGIVVAMVKDPWGNLFGLIHNPHFAVKA